jgi:hypothetical protein
MNTPFRTALTPSTVPSFQITHPKQLLLIGSCFTEHIGQKFSERKFNIRTNPFGIVYNPISMVQCLDRISLGNQPFTPDELFENAGLWHSWDHHGRFSKPDKNEALEGINSAYQAAVDHLKKTDFLLLTFGTADVFTLRETGQVVANNHKMPGPLFAPRQLSVLEMVDYTMGVLQKIRFLNADIQVVLTVSPVRHLRNGLIENQRSKARLVLACEEICARFDHAHYFPAYELLLDDLRDYRFYAADMIHPSDVAVDYVWQFFSDTFFGEKTRQLNERIDNIRAAALHRPFYPDTPQYQAFAKTQMELIEKIRHEMPEMDFSEEAAVFQKVLI